VRILRCRVGKLPSTYLGLPLGAKPPNSFWNGIIDRFNKKLVGWKGASLSQAGKCLLVKSTLQNLPMYALSLFWDTSKICRENEKYLEGFFMIGS